MVESTWPDLGGTKLRYQNHTWELTGDVEVRSAGELLAVAARRADGVRGERGTLFFGLATDGDSLNPGRLEEYFDRLERSGDDHYLVVKTDHRTYRYVLRRLAYE